MLAIPLRSAGRLGRLVISTSPKHINTSHYRMIFVKRTYAQTYWNCQTKTTICEQICLHNITTIKNSGDKYLQLISHLMFVNLSFWLSTFNSCVIINRVTHPPIHLFIPGWPLNDSVTHPYTYLSQVDVWLTQSPTNTHIYPRLTSDWLSHPHIHWVEFLHTKTKDSP